jgi:hypothetical protein
MNVRFYNWRQYWRERVRDMDGSAHPDVGGWYLVYMTCPKCKHDGSFVSRTEDGRVTGFASGGDLTDGHELHPTWQCGSCKQAYWVNWRAYLEPCELEDIQRSQEIGERLDQFMENLAQDPIEIDPSLSDEERRVQIREDVAKRMPD